MARVDTKKVRIRETGTEAIINVTDFDANLHEDLEETGDHNLVRAARSATTIEEIDAVGEKLEARRAQHKGKRASKEDAAEFDSLSDYVDAKRRVLEHELGPRFIKEPPRQVAPATEQVPYVPYMAPPSPGAALRTHGVDPEANLRAGAVQRTTARGPLDVVDTTDDSRQPKNLGTDAGAAAYGAKAVPGAGDAAQATEAALSPDAASKTKAPATRAGRGRKTAVKK